MKKLIIISIEGRESNTEREFFTKLFEPIKEVCSFFATEPDTKSAVKKIVSFVKNELSKNIFDDYLVSYETKVYFIYDDDKHEINWKNQQNIINEVENELIQSNLIKKSCFYDLCIENTKFDSVIYAMFSKQNLSDIDLNDVNRFIKHYRVKVSYDRNNSLWNFIDAKTNNCRHYDIDELISFLNLVMNEFKAYIPSKYVNFFSNLIDLAKLMK